MHWTFICAIHLQITMFMACKLLLASISSITLACVQRPISS